MYPLFIFVCLSIHPLIDLLILSSSYCSFDSVHPFASLKAVWLNTGVDRTVSCHKDQNNNNNNNELIINNARLVFR